MATTTQNTGREFLQLKVFLYKYTPPFTLTKSTPNPNIFKIDRYAVPLDPEFFSKYDITDLVNNYTFSQDISENTFSWTLTLSNPVISSANINTALKVFGPSLSVASLTNLAQYEAQAKPDTNGFDDTGFILNAKVRRGVAPDFLTVQNLDNVPVVDGLRVADLIQPYDIISVFLYKSLTPIDQITGQLVTHNGVPVFTTVKTGGRSLTPADLQNEYVLLSPSPTTPGQTLFSNEFNGFVMNKTFLHRIGSMDTVSISGNGLNRLLGSTRRILKGSTLGKNIYDVAEVTNPTQATPFENVYVGKTIKEIIADLFNIVYRITFLPSSGSSQTEVPGFINASNNNFFDLSSLIVNNSLQINQFTIPPYLLGQVMKLRGFSYREPLVGQEATLISGASNVALVNTGNTDGINQDAIGPYLNSQGGLQTSVTLNSPVFFSSELDQLQPYFFFMDEALRSFNAELKTPFEIIDELKSKTFIEFFESPSGFMISRPPQYNDTSSTVFSSFLEIIDTAYSETITNQVARQQVGYSSLLGTKLDPIQAFIYTNGKLLIQYGFMEADVDANPTVANTKLSSNTANLTKNSGFFAYAEFFLRIHNAGLKTGTITANLDPSVLVGKTYFDEVTQKFGYITSINKVVNVAGTATMTFGLAYVRDATLPTPSDKTASTLAFDQLPRLVDVAQQFSTAPLNASLSNPVPVPVIG